MSVTVQRASVSEAGSFVTAQVKRELDCRGVKVIGLSVDQLDRHAEWATDIEETQGAAPQRLRDRPGQDDQADPYLPMIEAVAQTLLGGPVEQPFRFSSMIATPSSVARSTTSSGRKASK